jgi:hypothetical protein
LLASQVKAVGMLNLVTLLLTAWTLLMLASSNGNAETT